MVTRRASLALALAVLPATLAAETTEWAPLEGDALARALTGKTVEYFPDFQIFFENGRTRYTLLSHRWGWWEIREGRYCDLWPPREDWACYDTDISPDGRSIRFTGDDGLVTEGTFREE